MLLPQVFLRSEKKSRYHDRNKVHATTPLWLVAHTHTHNAKENRGELSWRIAGCTETHVAPAFVIRTIGRCGAVVSVPSARLIVHDARRRSARRYELFPCKWPANRDAARSNEKPIHVWSFAEHEVNGDVKLLVGETRTNDVMTGRVVLSMGDRTANRCCTTLRARTRSCFFSFRRLLGVQRPVKFADRAFLIRSTIFAIATFVLLLLVLSVHSCSEMQVLHAIQLFAMHVIQDRNFFEVYK